MVMHHTKGLTGACMMMLCSLWLAVALKVGGRGGEGGGGIWKRKKNCTGNNIYSLGQCDKNFHCPKKVVYMLAQH